MTKNKVAIIIVNYNMPERTDDLVERINSLVSHPHDMIVVDNGSDLVEPSKYSNVFVSQNVQTTNGWLMGLAYADALEQINQEPYFAYWFLITSARIPEYIFRDPLADLVDILEERPDAVGVHPSLTSDSTTAWDHLKIRGYIHISGVRRVWMIDNIASLWRASFFNQTGRFDPRLIYGWGIDLRLSFEARRLGWSLFVSDKVIFEKITDIGYQMDRMNMTAEKRRELAQANMAEILSKKYGEDWEHKMRYDYVHDDWR